MGEEMIEAFDARGRSVHIPRQEWVESILPSALEANWDDADGLYDQIVMALRDGFAEHVAGAVERLRELDEYSQRSAIVQAIVQMKTGRLDDSERTLRETLDKHGESGVVLTNLAKIHFERGDQDQAVSALRYALKVDPNQDNALQWWGAIHRERAGEDTFLEAMRDIGSESGAWRPQLWIARSMLEGGRTDEAMSLYRHVINEAPDAGDALMMLSGDLGNAGHLESLIQLLEPLYDPESHGPLAGINLVRAYHATGKLDRGRDLLRRLQRLNRPELADFLSELEIELVESQPPRPVRESVSITVVRISPPIWTYQMARPDWLVPPATADGPTIAFLAFADITRRRDKCSRHERETDLGRLSRALPLFLAEALRLRTNAETQVLIPVADNSAPIVSGEPWDPDLVLDKMPPGERPDLLVSGHFVRERLRCTVVLELWDPLRRERIAVHKVRVGRGFGGSAAPVNEALGRLLEGRCGLAQIPVRASASFTLPPESVHDEYLSALGQLLVQVLAAAGAVDAGSLWNERGMFEFYLSLAERMPESVVPKVMAICALACASEYDSPILGQMKMAVREMMEQETDPASPLGRLAPLVWLFLGDIEAFETACDRAEHSPGEDYQDWIRRLRAA